MPPLLYRVEEAAEALRLSRTAINDLIRSGQLHTVNRQSPTVPVAALVNPEPGTHVLIVSYGCSVRTSRLRRSAEHSTVGFHQPAELNQ